MRVSSRSRTRIFFFFGAAKSCLMARWGSLTREDFLKLLEDFLRRCFLDTDFRVLDVTEDNDETEDSLRRRRYEFFRETPDVGAGTKGGGSPRRRRPRPLNQVHELNTNSMSLPVQRKDSICPSLSSVSSYAHWPKRQKELTRHEVNSWNDWIQMSIRVRDLRLKSSPFVIKEELVNTSTSHRWRLKNALYSKWISNGSFALKQTLSSLAN